MAFLCYFMQFSNVSWAVFSFNHIEVLKSEFLTNSYLPTFLCKWQHLHMMLHESVPIAILWHLHASISIFPLVLVFVHEWAFM